MPCRCVHEGLLLVTFRGVQAPDTERRSPMPGYAPAGPEAFTSSREGFEEIAGWLAGGEAAGLEHGELEDEIEVRGREVLRRMLQDHLALRASREERRRGVVADGVPRTRAEKGHERPLTSVFGQVRVSRLAYRAAGPGREEEGTGADRGREGDRHAPRFAAPGHGESRGRGGAQAGDAAVARGEAQPQADGR